MATPTGDEIGKLLPSVQIKKLLNEGKLSSSEERSLQEFCSQYNVDETAYKRYVEHLEFLDAKAKKRVRERNTLPFNISWKNEKRCGSAYEQPAENILKQHALKISGSKAELTKRGLSHARRNAARDVLEDEEFNNSCAWGRHPTRKLGMREPIRGGSRGGGGVDLNIISR